jgi:hypothetical protein
MRDGWNDLLNEQVIRWGFFGAKGMQINGEQDY